MELVTSRPSAKHSILAGYIPELLQQSFEQLVLEWEEDDFHEYEDLWILLHTLTTVSLSWKAVASSYPRLWRNLWNGEIPESNVPAVRALTSAFPPMNENETQYVYNTKCFQLSDLVPLHLHCDGVWYLFDLLDRLGPPRVSGVEVLRLEWPGDDGWGDEDTAAAMFPTFQRLLTMQLPNMRKLTIQTQSTFTTTWFHHMVSNLTSIESLVLCHISLWEPPPPMPPPANVFINLSTLQLVLRWNDICTIFSHILSAPTLRTLRLFPIDSHSRSALPPSFVPPPRTTWGIWDALRVLTVGGDIRFNELKAFLLLAPNVEVFEVHDLIAEVQHPLVIVLELDLIWADTLVNLLTISAGQPIYLPHLTTLRMASLSRSAPDAPVTLDWLINTRLSSPRVSRLQEIGLQIALETGPGDVSPGVWMEWLGRRDDFADEVRIVDWDPRMYLGL